MNELDKVANNTHNAKADSNSTAELLVFYKKDHVRQLSAHSIETSLVSVDNLVTDILPAPCSAFPSYSLWIVLQVASRMNAI